MAEQAEWSLIWLHTLKTGFLTIWLISEFDGANLFQQPESLTFALLNQDLSFFKKNKQKKNNVDPDQPASDKAI